MTVTVEQVMAHSEFADLDEDDVATALAEAVLSVARDQFGDKADLATLYRARHILTQDVAGNGANAGAMTSIRLLSYGASFAAPKASDDNELSSTAWGRRYQSIANGVLVDRSY